MNYLNFHLFLYTCINVYGLIGSKNDRSTEEKPLTPDVWTTNHLIEHSSIRAN